MRQYPAESKKVATKTVTYYMVSAKPKNDENAPWVSWLWNGAKLIDEMRTEEEVQVAATSKQFDVWYCQAYTRFGPTDKECDMMRTAIAVDLRKKGFNVMNRFLDFEFKVIMGFRSR